MSVIEAAQKGKGCVAGASDSLHPNCNSLLMKARKPLESECRFKGKSRYSEVMI